MANIATTNYKVTQTRSCKALKDLWSTLQKMEVNSKNIWLYQLAEHYGIDYEKKGISVRGHIYWAEFEAEEANDYYGMNFNVTMWCRGAQCAKLWGKLYDENLVYRSAMDILNVADPMGRGEVALAEAFNDRNISVFCFLSKILIFNSIPMSSLYQKPSI